MPFFDKRKQTVKQKMTDTGTIYYSTSEFASRMQLVDIIGNETTENFQLKTSSISLKRRTCTFLLKLNAHLSFSFSIFERARCSRV